MDTLRTDLQAVYMTAIGLIGAFASGVLTGVWILLF